jgi:hypothetical protein
LIPIYLGDVEQQLLWIAQGVEARVVQGVRSTCIDISNRLINALAAPYSPAVDEPNCFGGFVVLSFGHLQTH